MRLPLLPLRPTAAPGDGATPPTPAAAAAMDEAWGDEEMAVVRSILANIKAGDEEGAKELACDAVANFLSTNGRIHRLGAEDAIWATLLRNVFPNAPKVDMDLPHAVREPDPPPANNRAFFFLMCRRYKRLRKLRKKVERQAKVEAAAAEAMREADYAVQAWVQASWHPVDEENMTDEEHDALQESYRLLNSNYCRAHYNWKYKSHRKLHQLELWRDIAEQELTAWVAPLPPLETRKDLERPPPSELSSDEESADAALHGDED